VSATISSIAPRARRERDALQIEGAHATRSVATRHLPSARVDEAGDRCPTALRIGSSSGKSHARARVAVRGKRAAVGVVRAAWRRIFMLSRTLGRRRCDLSVRRIHGHARRLGRAIATCNDQRTDKHFENFHPQHPNANGAFPTSPPLTRRPPLSARRRTYRRHAGCPTSLQSCCLRDLPLRSRSRVSVLPRWTHRTSVRTRDVRV
jgi:hypothetical protein